MATVPTVLEQDTVRAHLATTWSLAEQSLAAFVASGATGLPTVLAGRLGREMDTARTALRERSFTASRDRAIAAWLPEALELAELANLLLRSCAHAGRAPGVEDHDLDVPAQVARLAGISPGLAASRVALDLARATVAVPDAPRFADSARELLTTAQLHLAAEPTSWPWSASILHVVERLLDEVGSVPGAVAEVVGPHPLAVAVVDLHATAPKQDLATTVPGLRPSSATAARRSGRWAVPAQDPARGDRVVVHLASTLIGPLRAAALDPEAPASPLTRS